jgi:hypothetical protein
MAWQPIRFRQDRYVRLFLLLKTGIVVVAKRSGRHLSCEHQVHEFGLRIGENVTDFPARNIGFNLSLLRKFESLPRKKELALITYLLPSFLLASSLQPYADA